MRIYIAEEAKSLGNAVKQKQNMKTSWNGNIFRVTGHLCGQFTGPRWIPRTKASDAELWCFLWMNSWVNNREAGDLRRHHTHYDGIVMGVGKPLLLVGFRLNIKTKYRDSHYNLYNRNPYIW